MALVIQVLECIVKIWLQLSTNDVVFFLLFFLSFRARQESVERVGFPPRLRWTYSVRRICLMTPSCIQGH